MKYYILALKNYAVFSGRTTRQEFWMFFLVNFLISISLSIIDNMLGTTYPVYTGVFIQSQGYIGSLYSLAVFIPNLSVGVRRLHDVNKSGWLILAPLILIIFAFFLSFSGQFVFGGLMIVLTIAAFIWLLVLFCIKGTTGENKYGPDPNGPLFTFSFDEDAPKEDAE